MSLQRQVLFVQGAGARVHDEWDNRLVESLRRALGPTCDVRYPLMPGEDDPDAAVWTATLQRELTGLREDAIVVGHSVGGTILLDAIADQSPPPVLGAIIVIAAPFIGEGGWPSDVGPPSAGIGARLPVGTPVHLFHGLADRTVPPSHADLYAREIPHAQLHRLPGRDHQLNDDLRDVAAVIETLSR